MVHMAKENIMFRKHDNNNTDGNSNNNILVVFNLVFDHCVTSCEVNSSLPSPAGSSLHLFCSATESSSGLSLLTLQQPRGLLAVSGSHWKSVPSVLFDQSVTSSTPQHFNSN